MSTSIHRVSRGRLTAIRWCGCFFAIAALGYVAAYLCYPDEVPLGLAAFGVVVFGGFAWLSIRHGRALQTHTLELSPEGIRKPSTGEWTPWSGVIGLRERAGLNRIDLLGPAGPTGVSLEYQLEGFQDVLDQVLARTEAARPEQQPVSFSRPLLSRPRLILLGVFVSMVALGAWAWISEKSWLGPILIAMALGAFVHDRITQVSRIDIEDEALSIRRGSGTKRFLLGDLSGVKLALRAIGNGHQYLDVFLDLDGELIPIRLAGVDPFALYFGIRAALRRAAA